ncbi:uncharacterized protein ACN427_010358 isoform 3-T4 [Glossina fuscipes fuscipes]
MNRYHHEFFRRTYSGMPECEQYTVRTIHGVTLHFLSKLYIYNIWLILIMKLRSFIILIILGSCLLECLTLVKGHGRLMDPPARNAMWRFGYPNPVNYNDNELFCGGYAVQWEQNAGRCGICGDAYHLKTPRPHEAGGEYGKGIISRYYTAGQEIEVEVELTANHYGRFEMYLCPNNNPRKEATQDCFNRFPLYISGSREYRYLIPRDAKKKDIFRYKVRLPAYVTCTQCVLQWTYYTANMWGTCSNGTEAVGCGKAETFRNCADVAIVSNTGGGLPPLFVNNRNPYLLYYRDFRAPLSRNIFPLIVRQTSRH